MTWFGWVMLVFYIFTLLFNVARTGKTLQPNIAVPATVIDLLIIGGILFVGTGHLA